MITNQLEHVLTLQRPSSHPPLHRFFSHSASSVGGGGQGGSSRVKGEGGGACRKSDHVRHHFTAPNTNRNWSGSVTFLSQGRGRSGYVIPHKCPNIRCRTPSCQPRQKKPNEKLKCAITRMLKVKKRTLFLFSSGKCSAQKYLQNPRFKRTK